MNAYVAHLVDMVTTLSSGIEPKVCCDGVRHISALSGVCDRNCFASHRGAYVVDG